MALANAYQIGTTLGALATLKSIGIPDPKSSYKPYADVIVLGNGANRGVGLPVAIWHWGYLTRAQRDLLRAFCTGASATIFIETRTNDTVDVFDQFTATMIWPADEMKDAGRRIDFVIEFRNLVAT